MTIVGDPVHLAERLDNIKTAGYSSNAPFFHSPFMTCQFSQAVLHFWDLASHDH